MIELTERAAKAVRALEKERGGEGQMLRIFIEAGGCSGFEYGMSIDHPKEQDTFFESHGVRFAVEPKSLKKIDGSIVDFDDGLTGKGFEIRNPQATSTCGCGKSFA